MKDLTSRTLSSQKVPKGDSNAAAFGLVRHYIGRLACPIRAAEIFVAASSRIPHLFDNPDVKSVQSSQWVRVPRRAIPKITPSRILTRMLPKDDSRLEGYEAKLAVMDQNFGIFKRLCDKLEDDKFKSRVHAELLMLQHFHSNKLRFVADDKYIGCSKPACYCCYRYIREHDEGFVLPSSHHKTYLNWRPPDIPDDKESEERWRVQRDIMIRVIRKINAQILEKIQLSRGPSNWRPDSTTGITSSLGAIGLQENDNTYTGSSRFPPHERMSF